MTDADCRVTDQTLCNIPRYNTSISTADRDRFLKASTPCITSDSSTDLKDTIFIWNYLKNFPFTFNNANFKYFSIDKI